MRILSVGSAFPQNLYPQETITSAIKQHWGERLEHPEVLDRLHSRSGVKQRYLSFPLEQYAQFETFGETLHRRHAHCLVHVHRDQARDARLIHGHAH